MWFRIEQNKDGSISTCAEVDPSLVGQGRSIIYIEADSATAACAKALARYTELRMANNAAHAKRATENRAQGLCACGRAREDSRWACCAVCRDRKREAYEAQKRGEPPKFKKAKTDVERLATEQRRLERGRKKDRVLYVYVKCLAAFDAMTPRNYREWLACEIEKRRAKARA